MVVLLIAKDLAEILEKSNFGSLGVKLEMCLQNLHREDMAPQESKKNIQFDTKLRDEIQDRRV